MRSIVLPLMVVGLMLSLLTVNPVAWALTLCAMAFFVSNFFKVGVYPVALMALAIPFLEIATSLLNVELSGMDLKSGFGSGAEKAYTLSMLSLVAFMLGFSLGNRKIGSLRPAGLQEALVQISMQRLVLAHVLLEMLFFAIRNTIGYRSALFQLVLHFQKFPLLLLYVIAWKFALEQKSRLLVFLVFAVNLVFRLTGFFSEWKELLFLAVFVAIGVSERLSLRSLRQLFVIGGIGGVALLTWQGVKMDYRNFLNGGARSQAVVVSGTEAFSKFVELTSGFWFDDNNEEMAGDAFESTLDRLGYLEFFAMTVDRVPDVIPHEGGGLLGDNLSFALVPRILNPNKGIKNDQWKVEYYANWPVSDHSSFSLGRYAEWYVDFGSIGMILFAFLIGVVGVQFFRLFKWSTNPVMCLVDAAYLMLVLQLWSSYQADEIVIYGQTVWGIVVYLLVGRRLVYWSIYRGAMARTMNRSAAGNEMNRTANAIAD